MWILICALLIAGLEAGAVPSGAAQTGRSQRGRKPDPPKPEQRGPYTLLQVLEGLKNIEAVEPGRMAELVGSRGVDFVRGPEVTEILKKAGASDALLALIPEPPAPPAPKVAGDLTVGCAPRDCEVVVDSRYQGPTANGRRQVTGLAPGDVEITVFSDGYDRATKRVTLAEGRPGEEVFTLQPSANTRDQLGAKFALESVNALGGMSGISDLPQVTGTVDLATENGPVQYAVRYVRSGAGGTLNVTGQNANCSVALGREGIKPVCKKPKPGVVDAVESVARMVWDHDVAVLLDRALSGHITAEAWLDARRLTSESATEKMVLHINADHLPVVIEVQPKNRPAEKVAYSDYATLGKSRYPMKTDVVQGGKPVGTVQFH